jgi:hypothetical protein
MARSRTFLHSGSYSQAEQRLLSRLRSPMDIQRFLDEELVYNKEAGGATCRSPRRVMRDRTAQCMEGALFAAAALEAQGHAALIVDLEATRDNDHVLAVFRRNGLWGAVAKSNFAGLRYREPVYRSLRELAISYFEHYFNLNRERTLRAYSKPVRLSRFDSISWRVSERDVWEIPMYLTSIRHFALLPAKAVSQLSRVDRRLFEAGYCGTVK